MKRLLLLRHAKAVPTSPGGDFERELAPRGRKDAAQMGAYMKVQGLVPDAIIASPARRTRETADLLRGAFTEPPDVELARELYLAEPQGLLARIRDTDPKIATLLVVAHNPGIGDLANLLTISGDPQARALMQLKFPTVALAVIDLPIELWQGASFHDGALQHFVTRKQLA